MLTSLSFIVSLVLLASLHSAVQALDCAPVVHWPTQYASWPMTFDKTQSTELTWVYILDHNDPTIKDNFPQPPRQMDYRLQLWTAFEMGDPQYNYYELGLGNNRAPGYNGPVPEMNKYIYTISWENPGDNKVIYKRSWYLSNFEGCHHDENTYNQLDYQHGKPKVTLTYYI